MSSLASVRGLAKTYRSSAGFVEALHDVDASFAAGEITAVVGPSGSGKSTLLRVLAGLEHPSGGEVVACGRDLTRLRGGGLRRYRRDSVAFVSQSPADNFLPQLTLAEHAGTGPGAALLARFGVEHRLGERPRALSGGEQARAAFALALAREAPLVLADEPTAELDGDSAARLLQMLRESAAGGHSFVVATHDPDVVAAADTVIRLERGRIAPAAAAGTRAAAAGRPRAGGEPVLAAEALTKSFGAVRAVDGASLALGRGELGVVVGRSGSGKSTLLNVLGGWQR
ncbi:MAG TPA: ATP-binding cassette domain-containing protein, partial [Gaiellaceae bacterium]|nr:ATP-binding cassette domain-containing protein [Gaiellaceae bacterium]